METDAGLIASFYTMLWMVHGKTVFELLLWAVFQFS